MKTAVSFSLTALAFLASQVVAPAQIALIVNGASFNPHQPIAPGSFATVFGQNLCPQTSIAAWIAPGKLPVALGPCSLTVNGTAAMLAYASSGQINFIVPSTAAPGTATVTVSNGSTTFSTPLTVSPSGPGLFTTNGMGIGDGAIVHGTLWSLGPFSVTTSGQPTPLSIFLTGLDLSTAPVVSVGGVPATVTWYGNAPGFAGLQQINIVLPASVAGAGRIPITVTSSGQTSNVAFITILPTDDMMKGMPGGILGEIVENRPRAHELSFMAANPANNTALVTDADDDVVRVIAVDSGNTLATITLPQDSHAREIAVNDAGTLAAVALSEKNSVALIDLTRNQVANIVATGYYPTHAVFSGTNVLVANGAGASVSVIDTTTATVARTLSVGAGPTGIDDSATQAVVANANDASVSVINLSNYAVANLPLPAGTRPYDVAVSASLNKAVITTPLANQFLVLDLAANSFTTIDTKPWNCIGPGEVVTHGNLAYIAFFLSANVAVYDLSAGKMVKTFSVDPGPRALSVNAPKNELLVLAEGTGTLDVVDLNSYTVTARFDAGATEREDTWIFPVITAVTPNSAAAGATVPLTITGMNLQGVTDLKFVASFMGVGEDHGPGMNNGNANFKVSDVQVSPDGTQLTATVQVLTSAAPGPRLVVLKTGHGPVMLSTAVFTVTQ